jgi:biotin carboxylase
MRTQAAEAGIPVPAFVHVLNHDRVRAYTERVPAPWVLKPRSQASAAGIKKIRSDEELWSTIEQLGDEQSYYLLEAFVPGSIYHVDLIVFDEQVVFARAHRYTAPPMEVAHEGGIFSTHTVAYGTDEEESLLDANRKVMEAMGLRRGVSHTEFIRAEDGTFYFLETSARVGGAHIAEMLEASSGVNLWAEWARIEALGPDERYTVPEARTDYSGVIISLARQERPDTGAYRDPDIVWRLDRPHHAGLIVRSGDLQRVKDLLHDYTLRFRTDFHAALPAAAKPTA